MDEIIEKLIEHLKEKHRDCEHLELEIRLCEEELPYMDSCEGLNTICCPYAECDYEFDFEAITTYILQEERQ